VGVAAVGRRYHLAENISAGGRRPSSPAHADPGPSAECDGEEIDGWMVLVLLVVLFIRAFLDFIYIQNFLTKLSEKLIRKKTNKTGHWLNIHARFPFLRCLFSLGNSFVQLLDLLLSPYLLICESLVSSFLLLLTFSQCISTRVDYLSWLIGRFHQGSRR
jgi:hypothetical protein